MPTTRPPLVRKTIGTIRRAVSDPLAYLPDRGRPPTSHPRVGLVGFYGWGNYGDELFLRAFREHLAPGIEITSLVGPDWIPGRPSLRRGVLGSDVVVIGGGDLVVPWAMTRYWRRILLRRPVFIAGVGVPMWGGASPDTVGELRRFFGHPNVRGIGVRDEPSAEWIREHLAPRPAVQVAPDLVCAIELPTVAREADPPIFGVAVRERDSVDDLSQVRRLCDRAVELGFRIRRIILGTGRVRENDLVATARLGLDDAELVSSDDLDVISRAIGECTVFATMKFHGAVVASMYGVPPIAMMPTTKNRNFMTAIGRPDLLTQFGAADLADHVDRDMAPIPPEIRDRLRADARAYLGGLRTDIFDAAAAGSGPRGG